MLAKPHESSRLSSELRAPDSVAYRQARLRGLSGAGVACRTVKDRNPLSPSRVMNATLSKALVTLVPAGILFVGSVLLFLRERTLGSFLQPLGAGCLVVVILTHVFEALHLLPWMQWDRIIASV